MNTPEDYRIRDRLVAVKLRQRWEDSLLKSIALTENGVRKNFGAKGWKCDYCPDKKLLQGRDAFKHMNSKGHAENLLLGKLAK
jgi:hypothetical protein